MTYQQMKAAWTKAGFEDYYHGKGALPSDWIMMDAYQKGWKLAEADDTGWWSVPKPEMKCA
jgi:hypothetical protein